MATIRDYLLRDELAISATGTSEGASKGWDTRVRGRMKVTQAPNSMPISKKTGDYSVPFGTEWVPDFMRRLSERGNKVLENQTRESHIAKKTSKGWKLEEKGKFPNGTLHHWLRSPNGKRVQYFTYGDKVVRN